MPAPMLAFRAVIASGGGTISSHYGSRKFTKFPIRISPANRLQELDRSLSIARRKLDETGMHAH
jgi:hypothetical protein